MQNIKIAVIGVGVMGKNHARIYSEIPNCKLVAVSDLEEKKAKEIADEFDCKYYTDLNEMLDKEDIDAVSITVPTKKHKEISLAVINKGLHILLEKPIATCIKDAEEIIKKSKEKKIKLLVGHIERFNPAVIELKKIIDQGKIGTISSIIARRVGLFPSRVKDANIVVDVSVHDIDIIKYLMGKEPDDIYACGGRTLNDSREDHVVAILKYGQASGIIQSNWITPIKIRNLSVTGVKGYVELNYITQELALYEANYEKTYDNYGDFIIKFGKQNKTYIEINKEEPLKVEIRHFIDCVRNNEEPLVNGDEALSTLKIALDINNKLRN